MEDHFPAVLDHELAIAVLQDLHVNACKAGPFLAREQLQSAQLVFDGVVPGHLAQVLEAQDPLQVEVDPKNWLFRTFGEGK